MYDKCELTAVLEKKVMALRIIPLYSNLKEGEKFLDRTKSRGTEPVLGKQGVEECDAKEEGKNQELRSYMITVNISCFEVMKQDQEERKGIDEKVAL